MSGSTAALTAAGTLTLEAANPAQPLALGPFVFADFEVPEKVTWGGTQRMNVHKFVGGGRIIDTMGPDDADIVWSGIFLSPDASLRADELDRMRRSGGVWELLFPNRYYQVVINQFSADTRHSSWVPYRITCTVLDDLSAYLPPASPPALQAAIQDFVAATAITALSSALTPAATAIAAASALAAPMTAISAGAAATVALVAGVSAATAAVAAVDTAAETQLAGFTAAANATAATGVLGVTTAIGATNAMAQAATATATAAMATATNAYLGCALINANSD
jgi:hypothetical protein